MATSLAGSTSLAPAAAAKPSGYQYLNKGWTDPLAQEIAKKYLYRPTTRTSMWNPAGPNDSYRRLSELSAAYHRGGASGGGYQDPLDPKNWRQSGVYTGEQADKMKQEYISRGGLGTYEQLAATNPSTIGWPTDAAGNPLPKLDTTTGKTLTASGSSFSLAPEVLAKMWR
jgi:hypothetical protein